jgi:4-aminobutyrate aminotransferase-like enzyme
MGNGHPLAGVVARPELIDAFTERNMYFNTFGGNPVSAAVGSAVLDVLEDERLVEQAARVGRYTLERLAGLKERHPLIGDVRGSGMFFAVELVNDRGSKTPATADTRRIVNGMYERGVLLSRIGRHDNILKIRPPMSFSRQHADLLVDTLDTVLKSL